MTILILTLWVLLGAFFSSVFWWCYQQYNKYMDDRIGRICSYAHYKKCPSRFMVLVFLITGFVMPATFIMMICALLTYYDEIAYNHKLNPHPLMKFCNWWKKPICD